MALSDELIAIKLELKGQRAAISGIKSVDKAQQGLGTSTTATGVAAEKAEKKTSRLSRAYASLGKTAKWGLGFLGVGGVFALKSAIDNTAELAKTTSGLTRNFGLQTNVASRWATVAHARSIDSKALSMAFATLSSRMVEAGRKGGTALTPFHQLGLTQEEVAKGAHNAEWGLMRVTKALGDMEGGAKRTTAAKAVFGKGFQTIVPLMSEGTKGLKEQLRWADKYGSLLDTKTNESLMGMVSAFRENKAAMFGLETQIAQRFAPTIVDASDVFQQFVAMLNNDDLTADQKLHRIEQQFLGIEDTLIDIVTAALPRVAEHGGELGLELAGAVWHGFKNSDLGGKLVISAWLLNFMGGGGLIRKTGGKAGKAIAWGLFSTLMPMLAAEFAVTGSFGLMLKARWANLGKVSGLVFTAGWVLGLVGFGFVLAEELDKRTHFRQWGINAAEDFANGMIDGLNKLSQLGKIPGEMNPVLELLGVDPSDPIPHVNLHDSSGTPKGKFGLPSADPNHPNNPFGIGGKHRHSGSGPRINTKSSIETPRLPHIRVGALSGGGGRPLVFHNHIHLDGKEIAENTAHHVAAAEALS